MSEEDQRSYDTYIDDLIDRAESKSLNELLKSLPDEPQLQLAVTDDWHIALSVLGAYVANLINERDALRRQLADANIRIELMEDKLQYPSH
jgi:hypothetical protein